MPGFDDLDLLDTFESGPLTMEELEEYEPKYKLKPIEEFDFLSGGLKPEPAYYSVIEAPDDLLSIFDDIIDPDDILTVGKPKGKLPRVHHGPVLAVGRDSITPEMRIFLTHYMGSGTVTTALRSSRIPLSRYRKWVELSPKFNQALCDSTDALADRLETEALKQALSGNTKVLLRALEALRPGKWGRSSTVNSFIDAKMKVEIVDWSQLSRRAEIVDVTPRLLEGGGEE